MSSGRVGLPPAIDALVQPSGAAVRNWRQSLGAALLDCIVHRLGLAGGGRPETNSAKRLTLPVSNDTLLRMVRQGAPNTLDLKELARIHDPEGIEHLLIARISSSSR